MINNQKEPSARVQCEVEDCEHHCTSGCCNATEIKVGPMNAHQCTETICSTFKKRTH